MQFCDRLLGEGNLAPAVSLVLQFQLEELATLRTLTVLVTCAPPPPATSPPAHHLPTPQPGDNAILR